MLCTLPQTNPVRSSCPIISVPWGIQIFDPGIKPLPLVPSHSLYHRFGTRGLKLQALIAGWLFRHVKDLGCCGTRDERLPLDLPPLMGFNRAKTTTPLFVIALLLLEKVGGALQNYSDVGKWATKHKLEKCFGIPLFCSNPFLWDLSQLMETPSPQE